MMKTRIRRKALLIALAGATAAALPVAAPARDNAQKAEAALARENADKAVSYAERAVIENPRDPETRVLLGQAYLKAGRLVSARDSLAAAVELGDASPRTALMLALAQVGAGEPRLAIGTINMQGSAIPSADRGLALALAGETARGVEVISADIRAGNNTPKSRQNLAYAYALDGRWREARAMAAQDVPADQIGDRMTEWASTARPDLYAQRVAALVGAEAVEDRGMPQQLALANSAPIPVQPPAPRMAAAPEPEPASKPAPAAVAEAQLDDAELPPVRQQARPAAPANSSTVSLAVVQPAPAAPSSRGKPKPVVVASLPPSSAAAPAPAAKPAAEPVRVAAAPAPAPKPAAKPAAKPAVKSASKPAAKPQLPVPAARGTHVAQLGSYASPDAAQAGWKVFQSRYANLKGAQPVITKATVDGKDYWRVAAGGFDRQGANAMCSAVKASGNGCIPIAQSNGTSGPNKARLATVD